MHKRKSLENMATSFLRNKGYTWAGNNKSDPEFKQIVENRREEKYYQVGPLGMLSKKKSGIISPRKRR